MLVRVLVLVLVLVLGGMRSSFADWERMGAVHVRSICLNTDCLGQSDESLSPTGGIPKLIALHLQPPAGCKAGRVNRPR